jgi:hypothetical protein
MSDKKVWFITGPSRGMDVQFAKAAFGGRIGCQSELAATPKDKTRSEDQA